MGRVRDTYNKSITCVYPDAVITVRFPDITDEEDARRFKALHDAAAGVIKERIRRGR